MEFIKCPKCGYPLIYKVTETTPYRVTSDGAYIFTSASFGPGPRIEEDVFCEKCQQTYSWMTNEEGKLLLLKIKHSKPYYF